VDSHHCSLPLPPGPCSLPLLPVSGIQECLAPEVVFFKHCSRESLVILEAPREIIGAIPVPSQQHLGAILAGRPPFSHHNLRPGLDIENLV
jgi:hypothetical protein